MNHQVRLFTIAILRTRATIVSFWLLLGVGFSVYLADPVTYLHSPFNVGDWVINYQAGFVRRGFIGEVLYQLARVSNVNIGFLAVYLQIILLIGIGSVVTYFALRSTSAWLPWIVLSPVGFLYATYNGDGGYRKELLLFSVLAMLALATRVTTRRAHLLLWLSLLTFVVTVLSWEPAVVTLPCIWWLCHANTQNQLPVKRFQWAFLTTGLVGLALASLFHGNAAQSQQICHSVLTLGGSHPSVCQGALAELSVTPHQQLSTLASFFPRYLWYGVFLLLALLPFALSGWFKENKRIALSVLASTSLLYFIGTDYGRWIHLQATCLAFLFLVRNNSSSGVKIAWGLERVALTLWVVAWSVPYSFNPLIWQGLVIGAWHKVVH